MKKKNNAKTNEQLVRKIRTIKIARILEKKIEGMLWILTHPSSTKLSEMGIEKSTKELILNELEDALDIEIRGIDREEIITIQDILTAVYLQQHKL